MPPSTHKPHRRGYSGRNGHNMGYVVGNWSTGTEFEVEKPYRQSDFGHNFYAGQTLVLDGRVTPFAWMGDFSHPIESQEWGWSGQLALPRDLGLNAELELTTTPILELAQLRGASHELGTVPLQAGGHPPHLRCAGC